MELSSSYGILSYLGSSLLIYFWFVDLFLRRHWLTSNYVASPQREQRYRQQRGGSRGGIELEGTLMLPRNEEHGRSFPLSFFLLLVHFILLSQLGMGIKKELIHICHMPMGVSDVLLLLLVYFWVPLPFSNYLLWSDMEGGIPSSLLFSELETRITLVFVSLTKRTE